MEQEGKRRNKWSQAEDEVIFAHVNQYGPKDWGKLAETLQATLGGSRTAKSCRLRWYNELTPTINRSPFSEVEMEFIMRAVLEYGTTWSRISAAMAAAGMTGRTDNAIKNCYHVRLKRAMQEQGLEAGAGLKPSTVIHVPAPANGRNNQNGGGNNSSRSHASSSIPSPDGLLAELAPHDHTILPNPYDYQLPTNPVLSLPYTTSGSYGVGPAVAPDGSGAIPAHMMHNPFAAAVGATPSASSCGDLQPSASIAPIDPGMGLMSGCSSPKRAGAKPRYRRVHKRASRLHVSVSQTLANSAEDEDAAQSDGDYHDGEGESGSKELEMMPQLPMDCTTPTRARRLHVKHHLADKFALRSINSAPNMDEHNNVLNTGLAGQVNSSPLAPPAWTASPAHSCGGYAPPVSPLAGGPVVPGAPHGLSVSLGGAGTGSPPPQRLPHPGQLASSNAFLALAHGPGGGMGAKGGARSPLHNSSNALWGAKGGVGVGMDGVPGVMSPPGGGISASWDMPLSRLAMSAKQTGQDRAGLYVSVGGAGGSHPGTPTADDPARSSLSLRFADLAIPNSPTAAQALDHQRRCSTSARLVTHPSTGLLPTGLTASELHLMPTTGMALAGGAELLTSPVTPAAYDPPILDLTSGNANHAGEGGFGSAHGPVILGKPEWVPGATMAAMSAHGGAAGTPYSMVGAGAGGADGSMRMMAPGGDMALHGGHGREGGGYALGAAQDSTDWQRAMLPGGGAAPAGLPPGAPTGAAPAANNGGIVISTSWDWNTAAASAPTTTGTRSSGPSQEALPADLLSMLLPSSRPTSLDQMQLSALAQDSAWQTRLSNPDLAKYINQQQNDDIDEASLAELQDILSRD